MQGHEGELSFTCKTISLYNYVVLLKPQLRYNYIYLNYAV